MFRLCPVRASGKSAALAPEQLRQGVRDNLQRLGLDVLDVVNLRIARDAHPPVVTGTVRNKTGRKINSAEVSYYFADTAGSLVGTDTTQVANVEPHGSVGFRMPLKIAKAEYVFVRDVHPN